MARHGGAFAKGIFYYEKVLAKVKKKFVNL
jgi:hypothetical protein